MRTPLSDILASDLLGPDWDLDEAVRRITAQPDRTIGEALLDQRNLAGIGTFYRAELLFLQGVHPRTPVSSASPISGASSSAAGSCCWPIDRVPSSPPPAIYGVAVVPMSSSGWGSRVDGVARRSVPKSSVRPARSDAATGAHAASPAHDRSGFSRRGRGNAHGVRGNAGTRLGWAAHAAPSVSALDNRPNGTRFRGRTKVMEVLQAGPPPAAPIAVELRDGQIYRWQEPP